MCTSPVTGAQCPCRWQLGQALAVRGQYSSGCRLPRALETPWRLFPASSSFQVFAQQPLLTHQCHAHWIYLWGLTESQRWACRRQWCTWGYRQRTIIMFARVWPFLNAFSNTVSRWFDQGLEFVVLSLHHLWLFCGPMDCTPPGSSVHGISQARI